MNFAENSAVVSYVSFALTIASILLAIIAIVYSFVSNSSTLNSINNLHAAAIEIKEGSETINRVATSFESNVCTVNEKLSATHDIVSEMSKSVQKNDALSGASEDTHDDSVSTLFNHSSNSGKLALYAAYIAHTKNVTTNCHKLLKVLGKGNEDYYWGWLMALSASRIIRIRSEKSNWTVTHMSKDLAKQIQEARAALKDDHSVEASEWGWCEEKAKQVEEFFCRVASSATSS